MRYFFSFCLLSVLVLTHSGASYFSEPTYSLTVHVEGCPSNSGYVLLVLFRGEEGFPGDVDQARAYLGAPVADNGAVLVFKDLPPGEYAIAALHDENENGELDTNFLGIPKEAYGASNDANNPFGPPKYKDAAFEVRGDTDITIRVHKVFQ